MSNDYFDSTINLVDFTRARGGPINSLSAQVEASFDKLPLLDTFKRQLQPTVAAGGTANAITASSTIPIDTYELSQRVSVLATGTNTGPATINVDGLGAKNILRGDGTALAVGDITSGNVLDLVYDGMQFRIVGTIVTVNQAGIDIVIQAAQAAATAALAAQAAAETAMAAAQAAIAPYTASDVLAKLLTVDGSGSGLDADVVRGTTPTATGIALLGAASANSAKSTLSLNSVDNTPDASKPVSTAQQAALDLKAPIASPAFTGSVTLPGDPTSDLHATTKSWVSSQIVGLTNLITKTEVACKTTGNITLSGEQTLDGVLTSASRVLVASQTAPAQNGIYVSSAGAWTRATDADAWDELVNAAIWVTSGTAGANTRWQCTSVSGGTLGTTAVTFAQIDASSSYTASGGITKSGSNFTLSNMAATSIKGNNTGGSAAPLDLTATQVTAMLNVFGAAKGLVPAVTSNGTRFLRDDATFTSALTPVSVAASGSVTGSNLSGTNTGDQTITLTSDVTGSGTGSFATTIAAKAVTLAKMADMATASVIYRKTAGTGAPEVQSLATLKTDLGLTGTNSGDQTTVTGNAGTATALQTARTIAISGGATGTATSFNGTANITIAVTALDMSKATAGTLPVARGGTGVTTSTGSGDLVLSASPTLTGTVGLASATLSGTLGAAQGTAAAPVYAFTGDTNTGIYQSALDTLDVTTGGVNRLSVSTTGITASVPIRHVDGSTAQPGVSFGSSPDMGFTLAASNILQAVVNGTSVARFYGPSTAGGIMFIPEGPVRTGDGTAAAPMHSFANDTDTGVYLITANTIGFATGGTNRVNISTTQLLLQAGMSLSVPSQTPASASATGSTGTITWDSSFIYICTALNTWKRVAIATW